MLYAANIFLHFLHLSVIGLNLFGWVHPKMRRFHRWFLIITLFFWGIVGPLIYSFGYCPLTDWQWQVKRALGETDLPRSYIDYLLRMAGITLNPDLIDLCVGIVFGLSCLIAFAFWWRERPRNTQQQKKDSPWPMTLK